MSNSKLFLILIVVFISSIFLAACGQTQAKTQYTGTCYKDAQTAATVCKITETGEIKKCPNEFTSERCHDFLVAGKNCQNIQFTGDSFSMDCSI